MKITETRKAIIELIEPYMDKTQDFGLIIKNGNEYHISSWGIENTECLVRGYKKEYGDNSLIIGHYDITAVLKYIRSNANNDKIGEVYKIKVAYDFEDELVDILGLETKDYTWRLLKQIKLPNKPLHLFTEEEDKQLLDLLLKLK